MDITELLAFSVKNKASDLHLSSGLPPMIRVHGDVRRINLPAMEHKDVHAMVYDIMNDGQRKHYEETLECDFSFEIPNLARFRVNAFVQNRGAAAVFRTIPSKVLTLEERVEGHLVILLDEPTSILSEDEVKLLFHIVRELTARASFIFVSHRMDEVMELSNRIYVMKDGQVVDVVDHGTASVEEIQQKMVGRNVDREYYREQRQKPYDTGKVLLEMDGVSLPGRVQDIWFRLHAGEVLCLVGTEGSGREAILRTFADHQTIRGTIRLGVSETIVHVWLSEPA